MTLDLKDPQYPEHNLGSLELSITLSPKEGDMRDAVRSLCELIYESDYSFISLSSLHTLLFFLSQGNHLFLSYLPGCTSSLTCHTKMQNNMPDILKPNIEILET